MSTPDYEIQRDIIILRGQAGEKGNQRAGCLGLKG